MWLVNLALRRPYTVWVGMLLILVLGALSYTRTPTDILPAIKAPVVVVFASYRGMPAPDMEQSVTAVLERALTRCDHLEHIESRSLLGIGIIKVYFRPEVDADLASSQVISIVNSEMQYLPTGMLPPTIMKYDASSIPVGNLVVSSSTRDDKYLLDLADHQLREEISSIEGLASAPVFGGVFRQVQIYVHPRTLEAMKLSPMDVARIVNTQSQVIPTGEIRIGSQNYYVSSNAMVSTPEEFAKIPLLADGRKIVYLGDVADVVDGQRWRTNIVHVDGRRAVYMPMLRQSGASAVRVVDNVKEFLPLLKERGVVPEDVDVEVAFDQAQYVRDAMANLRFEGILGACLASLVVLLFLGNLRGTWIVALAIPLSILFAFAGLFVAGQTLNIMTLGGLALVLGRVVDDTIVDVENTTRHLKMGKSPLEAVLASAREIAVPVLMATVTTVVVFLPLTMLTGVAKYLFTPLALSAGLAMFASYIVSRTVSPACCVRFLKVHPEGAARPRFPRPLLFFALGLAFIGGVCWLSAQFFPIPVEDLSEGKRNLVLAAYQGFALGGIAAAFVLLIAVLYWIAPAFDRLFLAFARRYMQALAFCLRWRSAVVTVLLACLVPAWLAFRGTGRELFPEIDSSEFTVHLRAAGGPRVEETERQVEHIEEMIAHGYKAGFQQFLNEVYLARESGDRDYLDDLREANPEAGDDLVERIIATANMDAGEQQLELERLEKEQFGRAFVIPPIVLPEDRDMVLSNIGLSSRWGAIYTPNNGPHAAFVRVQLRSGFEGRSIPTSVYVERLRRKLEFRWPTSDFFYETGGMIRRILNAGAVAPVEVQVYGRDNDSRRRVARFLDKQLSTLDSVQDTYQPQGMDLPQLKINVDRTQAARPGLTETDVVRNVITALMSSAQLAPNFWIDPQTGNFYIIGVQYPEESIDSIQTLEKIPITGGGGGKSAILRLEDVATIERTQGPIEVYHHNVNRVSQIYASATDNDLAAIDRDVRHVVEGLPLAFALSRLPDDKRQLAGNAGFRTQLEEYVAGRQPGLLGRTLGSKRKQPGNAALRKTIEKQTGVDPETLRLPQGVRVELRGEVRIMQDSFRQMAISLILAVLLVYLIMAAQFQSWLDPLIMIVAAPLGLIGVAWVLWLTGSTLNVQSLMGVLMMVGISVSNSVLLVEFANEKRREGQDARTAIAEAARVRLRPILMTSVATLCGLLPMAIHLHPGDEMNLPLARAVIGGLSSSTLLTLFVVPVLYTLFHRSQPASIPALKPAGGEQ